MIWQFDLILLIFLIGAALMALKARDLLVSAVILGVFGFLMCLLWAEMGAVDVAFTEAAVGAGVSTVILIATIYQTSRKSKD